MARYVDEPMPDNLQALPEFLARQFRGISAAIQELGAYHVITHGSSTQFTRAGYAPRDAETGKGTKFLHAAAAGSDFIGALRDGNGRVLWYWNSTPTLPNLYIVGNEPAFKITWHNSADINDGFHYAWAASATASTTITWIELFRIRTDGRAQFRSVAKASLPVATTAGCMLFCPDETGGATMIFSDGANWLRVQDRAIVS